MKTLTLKPGKERSLKRFHPWIYDSAIAKGGGDAGETVRVEGSEGQFLAWAAYSPKSKIRARVWTFDEAERVDSALFARRIVAAVAARSRMPIASSASRLVHAEADGLPGVIVDRYNDVLVAQFLSAGAERHKTALVQALISATGAQAVYERSDSGVRTLEGLEPTTGWLHPHEGLASTRLVMTEHNYQLALDIEEGHKTGFYLDQRDSRKLFADYAVRLGFKTMLNCYCYTGGFSVAAAAAQVAAGFSADALGHITSVDSSAPALARAAENWALNQLDPSRAEWLCQDVNATLRQFITAGRSFDAIILDPPKFAPTAAHAERAARAYKDINRLALKLLPPGGVLFTFSCSGGINEDLFHKIVASAGTDSRVDGYIAQRLGAAPDHPMTINFPEGEYLKGLVVVKR